MPGTFELIDAGMEALQRADAAVLWDLIRRAGKIDPPATPAERKTMEDRLRSFRQLLSLTRRNLQLLGTARRRTDAYGEPRN